MKKILIGIFLGLSCVAAKAEFTGDVRLACEALLCLSSGTRPAECAPAISRYFSISAKKMSDTIAQRKSFLNLCPTASYDDNMINLTDAIANGAGRCDAAYLNRTLSYTIMKKECQPRCWGDDCCVMVEMTVIGNKEPSYCNIYSSHGYVYKIGAAYVGIPEEGGRWVDNAQQELEK